MRLHSPMRPPRPGGPPRFRRRAIATVSGGALTLLTITPIAALTPAALAADRLAVLVGDVQSQLGCAEDWDPTCEATALTQNSDGTFTGEFDVPAGQWEVKIAMDGAWEESYGVGEDNLPLNLAAPATLSFTLDPETGQISLDSSDVAAPAAGAASAEDASIIVPAARAEHGAENYYFVMADRFADGDPANNTAGIPGDRMDHGYDPTDKGFYHGGDLQGVLQNLDYIESLGTTAIWLTPSFKNQPVQGEGADASAGYHGYWITDFTQIDPHLGGNEALEALTTAAHERDIKVYFDIITNHTADVIDYAEGEYSYIESTDVPWISADGTEYDAAALDAVANSSDFPTFNEDGFPYTPVRPEGAPTLVPDIFNDVTKYHNRGDSTWSGESVLHGDFVGLDDIMTEDPEVVEAFTEVYTAWMDMGIDGYRIDTVKHVNGQFWEQFMANLDAHRAEVNPDFFTFGEVYDADARLLAPYSRDTDMDATLDFAFQSAAVDFARGGNPASLHQFFTTDDYYTTTHSSAVMQPTFLGNHDMGRIGYFLQGAGNELDRSALAHDLMYLTRGQPVVYYGDEQGMAGTGGDKDARQSMFPSQVGEYQNQNLLDGTTLGTRDLLTETEAPLISRLSQLAELRDEHPALATGAQVSLESSSDAVAAFSRVLAQQPTEYVVVQNNTADTQTTTITTLTPGAQYSAVFASQGAQSVSSAGGAANAEGQLEVEVPALGSVVLHADRALPAATLTEANTPNLTVAPAPARGAGAGLAAIEAEVPGDAYTPVSFAVREVGTEQWTNLGTDDGAALDGTARVFHDVSDVAPGTIFEYRAVARSGPATATLAADETIAAASAIAVAGIDLVSAPGDSEFVTVPGTHNAAMGCTGGWMPDCAEAALTLDEDSGTYVGTFEVPAGTYEYKVAVGGSWDVNYGVGGVPDGENYTYTHDGGAITFIYDPRTHQAMTTAAGPIITLPGSFNAALGCPDDWMPGCLATIMFDPEDDGTYTFTTDAIPTGSHEVKVAHGRSWTENYGVDGTPDGDNYSFTTTAGQSVTFSYDITTHELTIDSADAALPGYGQQRAYWLTEDLLAFPGNLPSNAGDGSTFELYTSRTGGIALSEEEITGASVAIPLEVVEGGLPQEARARDPFIADYTALRLPTGLTDEQSAAVEDGYFGQSMIMRRSADGEPQALTGVQIARLLDDLYADAASEADLGLTFADGAPSVAVWAPTANDVNLLLWDNGAGTGEPQRIDMTRGDDGTWRANGQADWTDRAYRYEVNVYAPSVGEVVTNQVTDPYSVGLTLNSTHSVITDLTDPAWAPENWATTEAPRTDRAVDKSIYELHVRDFSINDETVPEELRGTYGAFALEDTAGTNHLRDLADAGLTSVHLLPTFDIATIEEDRARQVEPDIPPVGEPGTEFGPDGEGQQRLIAEVADQDGFNWGYDPFHYTTPEGSYASAGNQDGGERVAEFRSMVGGLHDMGLEVILDKVYNHTAASGQAQRSVLDRIVPGYYHRLSTTGTVETSTCCQNVATENQMAEKLMVDSVVTWARDYKVDGFRFDLMGHHSTANMLAVREALDALTVEDDGVDGSSIYLYGEGWNFGEVADGVRFEQAIQGNLGGTGIGTFSDRLRDAVNGGSPVDGSTYFQQGFGNGAYVDPNDRGYFDTREAERADALHQADLVRLGLAGNLRDFRFLTSSGDVQRGADLDYRGAPAGYAEQPDEVVTYVDAHDNETLFDHLVMKMPADSTVADRVRMNTISLGTVALSQTPSFWHAGTDLLRSKSLDRDSYNSGDWFNYIDWTGQESTFGRGLPPEEKNADHWDEMRPLLADPSNVPAPEHIAAANEQAKDLLNLRYSSPLFRLGSAEAIQQKVSFPGSGPDAQPGVVTMLIDDTLGTSVDENLDGVLVVFNATPDAVTQQIGQLAGGAAELSPIQAQGADEVVKQTSFDATTGSVTVPARTVAVLNVTDMGDGEPGQGSNVFLTDANEPIANTDFHLPIPAGATVLSGDWNGDGVDTLGWHEGNRFTLVSGNADPAVDGSVELTTVDYGRIGDVPLVGDWNGDGTDTIGVRRGNAVYLKDSLGGGNADREFAYGRAGDEVYAGHFGPGAGDTLAVRRGSEFYVKRSLSGGAADHQFAYGRVGDEVIVGDVAGNGNDAISVRRANMFHLKGTLSGGAADEQLAFGRPSDIPLLGTWTNDRSDTLGVVRP